MWRHSAVARAGHVPSPRAEAADAMNLLLDGAVDPMQIGAFLMLLRYRGEDPEEVTGLTMAAQTRTRLPGLDVALDWPSYGAGRTRKAPWFLLSALALGRAGIRVLMHGTNEFSGGMTVQQGLAALGLAPALDGAEAASALSRDGFAYVPVDALCREFAALLGLRRLFGLRSPVNTVARLLNPADAAAGVDGVFHPSYIETHLMVAERLARPKLLVLKGGGGEAERNPAKPTQIHTWDNQMGRVMATLPALAAGQGEEAADGAGFRRPLARRSACTGDRGADRGDDGARLDGIAARRRCRSADHSGKSVSERHDFACGSACNLIESGRSGGAKGPVMSFMRSVKRGAVAMIAPTLFLSVTGYFAWNATRGDHGLREYAVRQTQLVSAQKELAAAETERDKWETRVAGLRANHIDPDTLDERARAMLNLADPDDIVVPYGPGKDLF